MRTGIAPGKKSRLRYFTSARIEAEHNESVAVGHKTDRRSGKDRVVPDQRYGHDVDLVMFAFNFVETVGLRVQDGPPRAAARSARVGRSMSKPAPCPGRARLLTWEHKRRNSAHCRAAARSVVSDETVHMSTRARRKAQLTCVFPVQNRRTIRPFTIYKEVKTVEFATALDRYSGRLRLGPSPLRQKQSGREANLRCRRC